MPLTTEPNTVSLIAHPQNHFRRPLSRKLAAVVSSAFLCTSLVAFGGTVWIKSKVILAQYFIDHRQEETVLPKEETIQTQNSTANSAID